MENPRAHQTATWVRMLANAAHLRRLTAGRMKRIPRQKFPKAIEREYSKAIVSRFSIAVDDAFIDLQREVPHLLETASRNARIDSVSERGIPASWSRVFPVVRLDAGEGKRVRQLIEAAREKMNKSILTPEIERLAEQFGQRTASAQRVQLNRQVHAALGVDLFGGDERLKPLMEAFIDSNVGLIRKLSDEVAGRVETSVLRAVQDAKPWDVFSDELQEQFGFGENRARIIARDQIGKFYGQVNATRQRELGIRKFVWRTANDERVRDEHEKLDGHVFAYDDPPSEGLPGEPILCRCSAEPVFGDIAELLAE